MTTEAKVSHLVLNILTPSKHHDTQYCRVLNEKQGYNSVRMIVLTPHRKLR